MLKGKAPSPHPSVTVPVAVMVSTPDAFPVTVRSPMSVPTAGWPRRTCASNVAPVQSTAVPLTFTVVVALMPSSTV